MTYFDKIKEIILDMTPEEFVQFCGGDSPDNALCGLIPNEFAVCDGRPFDRCLLRCEICLTYYLNAGVSESGLERFQQHLKYQLGRE